MNSSGSVAVWCKSNRTRANRRFEAHFNYWHIRGDRSFGGKDNLSPRDFLEVGILFEEPSSLEEINVFIPLKLESNHVVDCSNYFRRAPLAEGVFNEPLVANARIPGVPCVELRRANGKHFASVFEFYCSKANLDTDTSVDGTVISISTESLKKVSLHLPKGELAYFRLRIYLPDANPFIKVMKPRGDWFLHSSYNEIEYVDFRFNETRTLPDEIQQRVDRDWDRALAPITLVAFLTAIPGKSQLSTLNAASYKMRLLEKPIWNTYVPSGIPDGMMVYHWKRARSDKPEKDWEVLDITDMTTFVRLESHHSPPASRILFLLIALAIGVVGSIAADWIPLPEQMRHTSYCELVQTYKPIVDGEKTRAQTFSGKCD